MAMMASSLLALLPVALHVPRTPLSPASSLRCSAACCSASSADEPFRGRVVPTNMFAAGEAEDDSVMDRSPDEDGMECSGRVVTELVDTTAPDGKGALPDRFMMAMRALRGEFSVLPEDADTETTEDAILSALVSFPAEIKLRIVSQPLEDAAADDLMDDIKQLGDSIGERSRASIPRRKPPPRRSPSHDCTRSVPLPAEGSSTTVQGTVRGRRRSIDFLLSAVPNAESLAALRATLKADARVQMVF